MKIIVTYASAGVGHFKAAHAIYDYLKEHCKEIELDLINVLQKATISLKVSYIWGYPFLVKYALWLWYLAFWITYAKVLRPITRPIISIINRLNTRNFSQLLIEKNPDFIISTHFLSSEISAHLKTKQKINSKLISIITDFGVHPFWLCKGTDIYVVASDFTKRQLISEGIKEDNIKVLGIPIESKFIVQYDKGMLCKKLGLKQDKFTVLIATGSFGIGPIEEIVDILYKEAQVLVVCANNKRLCARLKDKNYPDVLVFGFIDNIQELMAISDIIITKPGGLSISESLALDLFPVFIAPIPGQETENIKALAHYGIGIYPKNISEIKNIVINFKQHPEQLIKIKEIIAKIKKPNASGEICNVVCQGSFRNTC